MRTRSVARDVPLLFVILLALCGRMEGQQPPHCAQILFCGFNQEAAANDSAGIHKYSRDLIDLILPNQWTYGRSPSGRMETFEEEFLGEDYATKLANRLARAEEAARAGKGRLVPEKNVAVAFDELMKGVGAPSIKADYVSVRRFRAHAAAIKAFPALFSAGRNGADCNPGEAVFLLYLLISGNGALSERDLDSEVALMQMDSQLGSGGERNFGVAHMVVPGSSSGGLIFSYSSRHSRSANIKLFNRVAGVLGF